DPGPHVLETGEVEVALRGEMPVENRLADARLARDLCGRRPAVGALRERPAGRVEERGAALARCKTGHAARASASSGCCLRCACFLITSAATTAPEKAITAPTIIARDSPSTNACAGSAPPRPAVLASVLR